MNAFKTLVIAIALAAPAALISAPSMAGNGSGVYSPRLDHAQRNQRHRIGQGVRNGSLTARETGQLIRGQVRVNRMEHRFESDGVVTRGERRRMRGAMAVQSGRIWTKKHNRRRR